MSDIPRRNDITRNTPAELAVRTAVQIVEGVGAHPLLTDAVTLLEQARERVADYVDLQNTLGTIVGVAFNDDDADGVLDDGEKPSGVRSIGVLSSDGRVVVARTATTEAGAYTVRVPAGTYRVTRTDFPRGYRLSNNADGYVTVSVVAGGQTVVNLGTTNKPIVATPPAGSILEKLTTIAVGVGDLAKLPLSKTRSVLPSLRCTCLRVWNGSQDFAGYKPDDEQASALEYARAGCDAWWCVAQDGLSEAMAKNAVAWNLLLADDLVTKYDADPATRGKQISYIFGNEPDLLETKDGVKAKKYWLGSIDHYVDTCVAVGRALKAKHPGRFKFFSAGFSWDITNLERVAPTLAEVVDGFCFHGYPADLSDAGMNSVRRFIAVCAKLGREGCIDEGSPGYGAAVKAGTKTVERDWTAGWKTYLLKVDAWAKQYAAKITVILFNARDIGTQNSAGALFNADATLTACGKAVAEVAGK